MLKFRTHGKWILAGEHTVLRGGPALVFPVQSRYLDFEYEETNEPLSLNINHQNTDLEMAFWGVLEKSLQSLGLKRSDISGQLTLTSNIPVGAGMGASATLCASLACWFTALGHLKEEQQYEFAKSLENLFHGKSSGIDVAVALSKQALAFSKSDSMTAFEPAWQPHFYLSYCGKRGVTADCVTRVQALMEENPKLGESIDNDMKRAVAMCQIALTSDNQKGFLQEGIEMASHCFERWGLIGHELENHMSELKMHGALATKPTGSGDGGFVLSLWESDQLPENLGFELIKA